jgi:UPF0755 protein
MQRLIRLLRVAFILALIGLIVAAGWLVHFALTPVEVPADARELTVKKGRTVRGIGRDLVAAGVLREPWSFTWMARVLGRAHEVKAGSYELPGRITPYRLLEMIARGEVSQAQITFIEGWTFAQMRAALAEHASVRHDANPLSDAQLLRAIGAHEDHPEGLFFPDTYYFSPGTPDVKILARAYHTMQTRLHALWATRAPDLPYASPYEALVMASIVEKETGLQSERGMIAAVFVNRLKRNMRLQTDPTVIYGLGEAFDGNLRKRDLEADTPYNTYTRTGLPPTPIALPGQAALEAALRPAPSAALYFVSRGNGSSHFSDNLEEHNRAVRRYQLGQ